MLNRVWTVGQGVANRGGAQKRHASSEPSELGRQHGTSFASISNEAVMTRLSWTRSHPRINLLLRHYFRFPRYCLPTRTRLLLSSDESNCCSISSGPSESEFEPPTPAESVKTARSRSHDPANAASVLRRPSRIEHLSELFRFHQLKQICASILRAWTRSTVSWILTVFYIGDKIHIHRNNCEETSLKESIDSLSMHHWVHKWRHEGRCSRCGKSFQQKMFNFQQKEKETMAVACSWCKESYHLKHCFNREKLEERCHRGQLRELVVPPNWILRLPNRHRTKHKQVPANRQSRKPTRQFVVKPNDWSGGPSQPYCIWFNQSGGPGSDLFTVLKLCTLCAGCSIHDKSLISLASKDQNSGKLEVYRKLVTQLRILVCGGDGTVGWVLQTLDNLNWPAYPPMAIMPLGTGNDLSRCMGWGGTFSDEPLSQLLQAIFHETTVTHLDRLKTLLPVPASSRAYGEFTCHPNEICVVDTSDELSDAVQSSLPLTVMNNYFSIGADAHVALQFHHSRS
ncbi:diacylglycerol kinase catalytic domain protein, partial [Ostertagia ostertagi]